MRLIASRSLVMPVLLAAVILGIAGPVFADKWAFPAEVTRKTFEFGKSKFVIEMDATHERYFPPHTLLIYLNGELVAKYKNVGFTDVYASEDKKHFVGLSNRGIPGTAFVVFDAEGNLIREEKHRFLPVAIYTGMSVTLVRTWFDAEHPAVEFKADGQRLESVFVQGSNGQRYDLMKGDLGFKAGGGGGK